MRSHQKDPVRRLVKKNSTPVPEAVEAEENAEKDRMDGRSRQEEKRRGTGRNPNNRTGAQKWGQVTGFATGKLHKYL